MENVRWEMGGNLAIGFLHYGLLTMSHSSSQSMTYIKRSSLRGGTTKQSFLLVISYYKDCFVG